MNFKESKMKKNFKFLLAFGIAITTSISTIKSATVWNLPTSTFSNTSGTPLSFLTTVTGTPNTGAPYTINIPIGVVFTIDHIGFDLTTIGGDITINVLGNNASGGEIIFNKAHAKIYLNTGDKLFVNPSNTDGLKELNSFGQDRVFTSTTVYNGNQFPTIINSGGVEGSGSLVVLPVEMIKFDLVELDKVLEINWATASELNNDYFVVEHSLNGRDFEEIGLVNGSGTSTATHFYHFNYYYQEVGLHYFRLKQVDINGSFEYSKIITGHVKPVSSIEIQSFGDALLLKTEQDLNSTIDIIVSDLQGRRLLSRAIEPNETNLSLDISMIPTGIYVISANIDGLTSSKLVVK